MKKNIKYIDLTTTAFDTYRIYSENINKFNITTHDIELEDMGIKQEVVKNMLLVVNDIENIINMDNYNKFDIDICDVCEIRIVDNNEDEKTYIVSMSHEEYNRGQMNRLDENMLYISIIDEYKGNKEINKLIENL